MSDFVNTVDIIGDEALTDSIITRSLVEIKDNIVKTVGSYAFYNCKSLTTVDLPAVTTINGMSAFNGCENLASVNIPLVTNLGSSTFSGCKALTTADFPLLPKTSDAVFKDCTSLKTLNFPQVTEIGSNSFRSCIALSHANFPLATSIKNYAFQDCTALVSVDFPVAATVMDYAFSGCSALTTIDFPAVTSISSNAFKSCKSLTAIILRSGTMATLGNTNAFSGMPISGGTGYVYVPSALVDSYKTANNWSTYASQIRAIEDYPEICAPYSWGAVSYHIENGTYKSVYKIGDTIPLDLGSEGVINMQVAAFDSEPLADGSGNAPISWVAKELLAKPRRVNPALSGSSGAYVEGTGAIGGWEKCEMRTYLQNTIKPLIPADVASMIRFVTKTQSACDTSGNTFAQQTVDDVWIPGFGEVNTAEDGIYESLFPNSSSRIKSPVGGTNVCSWFLRDAYDKSDIRYVNSDGSMWNYSSPTSTRWICIGFCTGRS